MSIDLRGLVSGGLPVLWYRKNGRDIRCDSLVVHFGQTQPKRNMDVFWDVFRDVTWNENGGR